MHDNGIAHHINVLGRFCGRRDVRALDRSQADVLVLFGGSPLAGGDVLADALRKGVAAHSIIVGGEGHTTAALRERAAPVLPGHDLRRATEADIFAAYLDHVHGLRIDLLERESTNCGTNVENCLRLLAAEGIPHSRIVLIQDATMQRRMDAGFRRHLGETAELVNYAAYEVDVVERDGGLAFDREVPGMWSIEHYVSLLLGEIPRLTDDAEGYGPRGRGFIAHVAVPDDVVASFEAVRAAFGASAVRRADPRWAGGPLRA